MCDIFNSLGSFGVNVKPMHNYTPQSERLQICCGTWLCKGTSLETQVVWIPVPIPAESQINSDGKMRCHKEFIILPLK